MWLVGSVFVLGVGTAEELCAHVKISAGAGIACVCTCRSGMRRSGASAMTGTEGTQCRASERHTGTTQSAGSTGLQRQARRRLHARPRQSTLRYCPNRHCCPKPIHLPAPAVPTSSQQSPAIPRSPPHPRCSPSNTSRSGLPSSAAASATRLRCPPLSCVVCGGARGEIKHTQRQRDVGNCHAHCSSPARAPASFTSLKFLDTASDNIQPCPSPAMISSTP